VFGVVVAGGAVVCVFGCSYGGAVGGCVADAANVVVVDDVVMRVMGSRCVVVVSVR